MQRSWRKYAGEYRLEIPDARGVHSFAEWGDVSATISTDYVPRATDRADSTDAIVGDDFYRDADPAAATAKYCDECADNGDKYGGTVATVSDHYGDQVAGASGSY